MAPCMKSHQILLLLAMLVAAILLPKGGESVPFKVKVQIINKLSEEQDMIVHCKDKHHDLGKQKIEYEKVFEFSLHQNVFIPNVLYYCSFWWDGLPKAVYFDIYKQTRDYKCNTCTWEVSESGPCKGDDCYDWNDDSPTPLLASPPPLHAALLLMNETKVH